MARTVPCVPRPAYRTLCTPPCVPRRTLCADPVYLALCTAPCVPHPLYHTLCTAPCVSLTVTSSIGDTISDSTAPLAAAAMGTAAIGTSDASSGGVPDPWWGPWRLCRRSMHPAAAAAVNTAAPAPPAVSLAARGRWAAAFSPPSPTPNATGAAAAFSPPSPTPNATGAACAPPAGSRCGALAADARSAGAAPACAAVPSPSPSAAAPSVPTPTPAPAAAAPPPPPPPPFISNASGASTCSMREYTAYVKPASTAPPTSGDDIPRNSARTPSSETIERAQCSMPAEVVQGEAECVCGGGEGAECGAFTWRVEGRGNISGGAECTAGTGRAECTAGIRRAGCTAGIRRAGYTAGIRRAECTAGIRRAGCTRAGHGASFCTKEGNPCVQRPPLSMLLDWLTSGITARSSRRDTSGRPDRVNKITNMQKKLTWPDRVNKSTNMQTKQTWPDRVNKRTNMQTKLTWPDRVNKSTNMQTKLTWPDWVDKRTNMQTTLLYPRTL
eukprot:365402-Chlamydomonas_euryale.AAC.5